MSAGADVVNRLAEKQLPSFALGRITARSARPDPCTTLWVTWFPVADVGTAWSPTLGASAIPTLALSTTRFFVIVFPIPPTITIPPPSAASKASSPDRARALVAVGVDHVAGDRRQGLRRQLFTVEAVGHDAGPVARPHRVHDEEVTRRIRARVADLVVLGHDVGDDRVTRVALPDVEAGVGAARRVRVVELPVLGVVRVDAVVAVAVRGEVRAPVAEDAAPEDPVLGVVAGGEVLDRDTVGARPRTHRWHAGTRRRGSYGCGRRRGARCRRWRSRRSPGTPPATRGPGRPPWRGRRPPGSSWRRPGTRMVRPVASKVGGSWSPPPTDGSGVAAAASPIPSSACWPLVGVPWSVQ